MNRMVKVLSKSFVLPCRYCKLNCLIAGSFMDSFRLGHVHQLAVSCSCSQIISIHAFAEILHKSMASVAGKTVKLSSLPFYICIYIYLCILYGHIYEYIYIYIYIHYTPRLEKLSGTWTSLKRFPDFQLNMEMHQDS